MGHFGIADQAFRWRDSRVSAHGHDLRHRFPVDVRPLDLLGAFRCALFTAIATCMVHRRRWLVRLSLCLLQGYDTGPRRRSQPSCLPLAAADRPIVGLPAGRETTSSVHRWGPGALAGCWLLISRNADGFAWENLPGYLVALS